MHISLGMGAATYLPKSSSCLGISLHPWPALDMPVLGMPAIRCAWLPRNVKKLPALDMVGKERALLTLRILGILGILHRVAHRTYCPRKKCLAILTLLAKPAGISFLSRKSAAVSNIKESIVQQEQSVLHCGPPGLVSYGTCLC